MAQLTKGLPRLRVCDRKRSFVDIYRVLQTMTDRKISYKSLHQHSLVKPQQSCHLPLTWRRSLDKQSHHYYTNDYFTFLSPAYRGSHRTSLWTCKRAGTPHRPHSVQTIPHTSYYNLSGKDAAAKEWREGRNEWHNTLGIIFLYKSKIIIGIILHRGDVTCCRVIGLSYIVWGVLLIRCNLFLVNIYIYIYI